MKFTDKNPYSSYRRRDKDKPNEYTLAEVLSYQMEPPSYGYGGIENSLSDVQSNLTNTVMLLSNLIEKLYDVGVISEEIVMSLVNDYHFIRMEEMFDITDEPDSFFKVGDIVKVIDASDDLFGKFPYPLGEILTVSGLKGGMVGFYNIRAYWKQKRFIKVCKDD